MKSVLISDDYPLVRLAIVQLLRLQFPNLLIKEQDTSVDLLTAVRAQKFDMLIMDNDLTVESNIVVMSSIRIVQPSIQILFFSDRNEDFFSLPLIHAGANGFLAKGSTEDEFKNAILQIYSGKKYLSRRIQQNMMNQILDGVPMYSPSLGAILTFREIEVLRLLLKGFRTAEIGDEMNIRPSTVSTFKMKILTKMGVKNIIELSQKAKIYESSLQ